MRHFKILLLVLIAIGISSCQKKEEKEPPVAVFEIVPASGPFTQLFTFNAHDTYDNSEPNENLRIRWDWEGDGIYDTEYSLNRSFEHQYSKADNYTVVMEVINSAGWTDNEFSQLVVYSDSVPPNASFEILPDSASVNTIFLYSAGKSNDQYTPLEELQFRWDWQNDGVWDTPFIADTTIYHKYDNEGVYRVLMEVRNNITMTDTTSRVVHVYEL